MLCVESKNDVLNSVQNIKIISGHNRHQGDLACVLDRKFLQHACINVEYYTNLHETNACLYYKT